MTEALIQQAADLLKNSQHLAVLTGAGVSKESGVPTFRDAQTGLWAQYDPQQLATAGAFQANPKLVWDWYEWRRARVREAKPNPGHLALAALERHLPAMTVITQNVDDLHEQAGSKNVIHLHGNIAQSKCFNDCRGHPTLIDLTTLTWDAEAGPPKCPHCGAWVRPDVVWFGEMLPTLELNKAIHISTTCDVMLVIGTSGLVSPAADMPGYAKQYGAQVIEVNPDYTMITRLAHVKLEGPSGEMLPRVLAAMGLADA
ncbi:MAG: NAD-dependent deacylase [Anaerolineae bacterium]